ncbi:LCP family protein [Aeromicrobium sp. 50.2.37]|uniref:LCP family protein n=1 Tax=Aeromicrobium sp. 50.2.37 TaxID=2969305 RepID=UPI00214F6F11|nr:LCP family protein [Aeromicrobium sp. 50.2.37]MCR4512709.1 LCP family protein [Aeromicrobium sp. 50.2.37]
MSRREKRARRELKGKRRAGGIPFHRRHRKLVVGVVGALVLVLGTGTAYAYYLNAQLGNVGRVETKLKEADRPDPDKGKALNILLLGSDKGKKVEGAEDTTLAEDAASGSWPAGKYRSDTLMIAHITSDRKKVYLVSIPRDTYTDIYDETGAKQSTQKINDAFAEYGPNGAISTVENLTDLRMRHLAIIDWDGFKSLSKAVGGVPVYIPRAFYDPKQKVQWEAGEQTLEGKKALAYVRTRYGLLRGDFDRIARQQNFLRSLMKKMLARDTMSNPIKLTRTLTAVTKNLTVDAGWDPGDMRALALSLRGTGSDDVTFLTAPVATTETIPVVGSIVRLDEAKNTELFTALREDRMDEYLEKYPDDQLADEDQIG